MNRPTGVTILAILAFIGTACLAILGLLSFVGGAFIGAMIGGAAQQHGAGAAGAGFGAMLGAFVGIFFLFAAVLDLCCGIGLWRLKEWGRILTIVLCGVAVVLGAVGLLTSMLHFNMILMMWRVFWLAIDVLIIWYLTQPQVKAAFTSAQMPPQAYAAR